MESKCHCNNDILCVGRTGLSKDAWMSWSSTRTIVTKWARNIPTDGVRYGYSTCPISVSEYSEFPWDEMRIVD